MPGMIVDTGTEAWREAGDCDNLLLLLLFLRQAFDGPPSGNVSKRARVSRDGFSNEKASLQLACFVVVLRSPASAVP